MLCTDSLEDVAVHPALNATQRIPAQNIHVVCLGYLIARVFRAESPPLRYLVPTGDGAHSPKTATRGCSPFAALAAFGMRSPNDFQKSNWIRHAIDHECRERVGSIQRDVSPLLNRGTNIQAMCLQSRKKAVSV